MAIENYRLYSEIRDLFNGFVEASVSVIEARDPSTGGHSYRVAALTNRLARAVDESQVKPFANIQFNEQQLTELHYAAMLHDFGKVGVREEILLKSEKLFGWEMANIEARFKILSLEVALEASEGSRPRDEADKRLKALRTDLATIRRFKRPEEHATPRDIAELERIARDWKLGELNQPMLSKRELRRLCIPIGSLDEEERREIESHVSHTYNFLRVIPWTRALRRVPDLAYAHHEKMDGSGYPRGLKGDDIPMGAKLMTIADIFDALTAGDRPYRTGMPAVRAIQLLYDEAARGHLLNEAVELFSARRLWHGLV